MWWYIKDKGFIKNKKKFKKYSPTVEEKLYIYSTAQREAEIWVLWTSTFISKQTNRLNNQRKKTNKQKQTTTRLQKWTHFNLVCSVLDFILLHSTVLQHELILWSRVSHRESYPLLHYKHRMRRELLDRTAVFIRWTLLLAQMTNHFRIRKIPETLKKPSRITIWEQNTTSHSQNAGQGLAGVFEVANTASCTRNLVRDGYIYINALNYIACYVLPTLKPIHNLKKKK